MQTEKDMSDNLLKFYPSFEEWLADGLSNLWDRATIEQSGWDAFQKAVLSNQKQ